MTVEMKLKNLIVFDMDGVIMDVSGSYRDVVRKTATLFFSPGRAAAKLPQPLFELSDLAAVKQSGGLNNDWDLTYVVINLLMSLIQAPQIDAGKDPWTRYQKTMRRCDLTALAEFLTSTGQPLAFLLKLKGKPHDDFIAGLYAGEVGSGNVIKQIFQEIYLGEALFQSTYHLKPKVYRGEGYILREKPLVPKPVLEQLSEANLLAIATGRPKAEADYPLRHFGLGQYFKTVYTLDDCLEEEQKIYTQSGTPVSLSKPDPFMLDAIAKNYREAVDGFYYIGDMPDDMLAAARSRYGFKSVGILVSAPDKKALKKELQRAGADYLVEDFEALKKIFL